MTADSRVCAQRLASWACPPYVTCRLSRAGERVHQACAQQQRHRRHVCAGAGRRRRPAGASQSFQSPHPSYPQGSLKSFRPRPVPAQPLWWAAQSAVDPGTHVHPVFAEASTKSTTSLPPGRYRRLRGWGTPWRRTTPTASQTTAIAWCAAAQHNAQCEGCSWPAHWRLLQGQSVIQSMPVSLKPPFRRPRSSELRTD